jgi:hypothetical protein
MLTGLEIWRHLLIALLTGNTKFDQNPLGDFGNQTCGRMDIASQFCINFMF